MKRKPTTIAIALASAVGVLSVALTQLDHQAPGPVSAVHAAVPELEGGANCAGCHGGWFADMQEACAACHEPITEQIATGTGLHGTVEGGRGNRCSDCHGEHHGERFRLVNRLAFTLAGVPDVAAFDHQRIGVVLEGSHVGLACDKCHEHAEVEVLAAGQHRFLGLDRSCASCHDDPHEGRMQLECTTCHTQQQFTERVVPDHDRFVALTGAHADLDCRSCHEPGTRFALEAMTPAVARTSRGCADCHEDPHRDGFVAANAALAGLPSSQSCAACHRPLHGSFAGSHIALTAEQHALTGFPLDAPHAELACAQCHDAETAGYADRHPGRGPDDCHRCHDDPHSGQFAAGPFGEDGCLACHSRTEFAPHAFDLAHHARTALPLDGRHTELDCVSCHADPAAGEPRRFAGTPHRCEKCHDDAHRGAFDEHTADLAADPRGTCAVCHGTLAFAELDHQQFRHEHWTDFSLDGAHAQAACEVCHERAERPDADGRRFGRVAATDAALASCTHCHRDPHAGRFDAEGLPATVDGRTGCARCHGTASFRSLPDGFEHERFTGFPLAGRHGELACSSCHVAGAEPPPPDRLTYPPRGRRCEDCHADPHGRQFAAFDRTDCDRCHKSTVTFRTISFRHDLDSRFRLGEAHAKVPCSSCHEPAEIEGQATIRYKPLPTACVDCHGTDRGGAPPRR